MFDPIAFPNLGTEGHTPRSPKSDKYNCIAWAAGESHRWWWPTFLYYWPNGVRRSDTVEAFLEAFASCGYAACDDTECSNPLHEPNVDRVALYVLNGAPKHAARQIDARIWTSKMGRNIDLEHTLRALEGPSYGWVRKILKRPRAP
jgi:hypothetical protein